MNYVVDEESIRRVVNLLPIQHYHEGRTPSHICDRYNDMAEVIGITLGKEWAKMFYTYIYERQGFSRGSFLNRVLTWVSILPIRADQKVSSAAEYLAESLMSHHKAEWVKVTVQNKRPDDDEHGLTVTSPDGVGLSFLFTYG